MAVNNLQKGLVRLAGVHHQRQLESQPRQRVDGAIWWRRGKNHETGIPARGARSTVLWQRCASREYSGWTMRLQISFLFPKLTKEQQEMLMEKKLKQFEQEPQ